MTTERGKAKMNMQRAVNNADRILDRLMYLADLYNDFPEFADDIKLACVNAITLRDFLRSLLVRLP